MKKKIIYYIYGLIGVIGFAIFIYYVANFYPHIWILSDPNLKKFIGENVMSRWAFFSYFTYQTLLLFSTWCILFFITNIFKVKKLEKFVYNEFVVLFLTANYILTAVLYTVFELITPTNFGLYDYGVPHAWINFFLNITIHYVIPIFVLFMFVKIKTTKPITKLAYCFATIYLLLYYVVVKLTGLYCYSIIWYPYIIFDMPSMLTLFGLSNVPNWAGALIMVGIYLIMFAAYLALIKGLSVLKRKLGNKKVVETIENNNS